MPVYPGTPNINISRFGHIETDGFRELNIGITTHTGTHIDAPAHVLKNGKSLDMYNTDRFIGKGIVLPHNSELPLSIETIKKKITKDINISFVLINTQHDKHWGSNKYFQESPFPCLDVIEYLAQLPIKAIGIDSLSIDSLSHQTLPNHHCLLKSDILIIENLTNLHHLIDKEFQLFCFPLNIEKSDGSPVRAVAEIL